MKINENYLNLKGSYLFADIAKKVAGFKSANPNIDVISLGIGDVTLPLCDAVVTAMREATAEMGVKETFRGYEPKGLGYEFLRGAIVDYYATKGVKLDMEEVFVSDGAKSDLGNFPDILSTDNKVLVPDPVYPAYVDVNVMAGRKIDTIQGREENGFRPLPDELYKADIIYLCSPNNPTGAVYTKDELRQWVDYANNCGALIIFDAAYEAFISDMTLPRSIFEIEGARTCAVEINSFSKTAGFTGTRCGYTVVPAQLTFGGTSLNALWTRRQTTKFNGVPYIVQRGAEAVFSPRGLRETKANIEYYCENARSVSAALSSKGIWHVGGKNSPYIWLKCPTPKSWDFFDRLLKVGVVGTPGVGFGENGEGYFRLTAFGDKEKTQEAVRRMLAAI